MTFQEYLKSIEACSGAIEWVSDKTPQQCWDTCENGLWMWWTLRKTGNLTTKHAVMFANFCADNARKWAELASEYDEQAAEQAAERAAAYAEQATKDAEWAAAYAELAAEDAERAAAYAAWAAWAAKLAAERKAQADFIRSIIKFEDVKINENIN